MIEIKHLTKSYGDVSPLQDISVDIHDGDIISIIGPSGTGKSTLLRCMNLLEQPTEGQIIVDGVDLTKKNCKLNLVRQKMGMVFQSFNLFAHMNVIENITYAPMKLLGLSKEEAYTRGMELLRMVSLDEKELAYPDELSGGQKQRIAIARTLAMDPKIILFDEPTSSLDPTMVREVLTVIKRLADKGLTMIIVTHEMQFARDVSNRIFYMDQGKIYEDGSPEQIFEHPQKERTRRFVQRIRTYEKEIRKRGFDYIGMLSEIEEFGRKQMLSQRTIYRINVVLEELCLQTLFPLLEDEENLTFRIEHSDKLGETRIDIESGALPENSALTKIDPLAQKLLLHAADSMTQDETGIHLLLNSEA